MARTFSLFTVIALTIVNLVSGAPTATAGPVNEVEPRVQVVKRGETFYSIATYFHPATEGGLVGSCGSRESDSSQIVALNGPQYGKTSKKSSWCGKKVVGDYGVGEGHISWSVL